MNHRHESDAEYIRRKLRHIERAFHALFQRLNEGFQTVAQELETLRAQVARNTEVDASAVALLRGIKAKLDAAIAAGDPAALTELSNSLGASTDSLAAAVVENTPSA